MQALATLWSYVVYALCRPLLAIATLKNELRGHTEGSVIISPALSTLFTHTLIKMRGYKKVYLGVMYALHLSQLRTHTHTKAEFHIRSKSNVPHYACILPSSTELL